jgi:hypothetical protein
MARKTAKTLKASPRSLEEQFEETAFRLAQERNDFLLPQVIDFVSKEKWLNLRPEYQRRLVWNDERRSLFIESLLLNVPIPPVFLYEWDLGRYEVMDGQQRLNAIVSFYENGFALTGLERWGDLNGLRWRDLPEVIRRGLDRRRISATTLLLDHAGSQNVHIQRSDIRKLVFERLNTGGLRLNAQELRNCLYASPFNQLLIELAHERSFCNSWGIPAYEDNVDKHGAITAKLRDNPYYQRMHDCEIVLRFFALRDRTNIRGSMKAMLDRCMENNLTTTQDDLLLMATDFRERIRVATKIFGAETFRYRPSETDVWTPSQPLYDGVMIAIDNLWGQRTALVANRARVRVALARLLEKPDAFEVIVGKPNTSKAVKLRHDWLTKTFARAAS